MTTEYFTASGNPSTLGAGASATMRTEFANIESGFAKLATLSGNAGKLIRVNAGGTAQESVPVSTLLSQEIAFPAALTPAQITADTNNYAPTGLSTASSLRLSTDASRNITGLTGGTAGRIMILHNVGLSNIVLLDENSSSSAANRFNLVSSDLKIYPDMSVMLQYDATASRWNIVGHTDPYYIGLDLNKFNGKGDGTLDNTAAFLRAMDEIASSGVRGIITMSGGGWKFSGTGGGDSIVHGFHVPYGSGFSDALQKVIVQGEGISTRILCNTNNMIAARISGCFGGVRDMSFDRNGKTGCTAVYLGHDSSTDTSTAQTQEHNELSKIWVLPGFDTGIWLRPGPHAGGSDSQVLSNDLLKIYVQSATTCILFDNNVSGGGVGAVNRNNLAYFAVGQAGSSIGIDIRNGAQNSISHGVINGVNAGAQTGLKIAASGSGGACDLNVASFVSCEHNGLFDLDNANANTGIVFGFFNIKDKFTGTMPGLCIPSAGMESFMPLIIGSLREGFGVPGVASGYMQSGEIADYLKNWQTYAITTGGVSNITSTASNTSYWRQSNNGCVEWHFTLNFRATTSNANLRISPPATPLAALFTPHTSNNPRYNVWVIGAAGTKQQVECGFETTAAPYLYVVPPSTAGNWDDAANDNWVWASIEFHT